MMRPNFYPIFRLLAVLLTIFMVAAHQYLPPKILLLYPDPERLSWIYGPEHQGATSTDWIDRDNGHFWCNYAAGDTYSCGWSLNLGPDRTTGLDLSDFDGFNITLHYEGNAPRVRLYLRDFNPVYSDITTYDVSSKVLSTTIRTSDLNKQTYVSLNEFSVAEWWITEFDIERQYSAPSFNNVIVFGIDFNVYSKGNIRMERIEAVGQWIKKETLYFFIIFAWMTLVVFEVALRFYLTHKQTKDDALRIHRLANEYRKLEKERQEFETLSTTDALTGIMNRTGIQQVLQKNFDKGAADYQIGVLLFDIDYFKQINDQYGHDIGDLVLTQVAGLINQNIRHGDLLGRWGGEEFLLICAQMQEERLNLLAEKIRLIIEQHTFGTENHSMRVTVSIGATIAHSYENFDVTFKRADNALYRAKRSGRNRVHQANI